MAPFPLITRVSPVSSALLSSTVHTTLSSVVAPQLPLSITMLSSADSSDPSSAACSVMLSSSASKTISSSTSSVLSTLPSSAVCSSGICSSTICSPALTTAAFSDSTSAACATNIVLGITELTVSIPTPNNAIHFFLINTIPLLYIPIFLSLKRMKQFIQPLYFIIYGYKFRYNNILSLNSINKL